MKSYFGCAKRSNRFTSDYIAFAEAVKSRNYPKKKIRKWFKELVSKDNYAKEDQAQILNFLFNLSFGNG